jgi:hypothetical protein
VDDPAEDGVPEEEEEDDPEDEDEGLLWTSTPPAK